jgi:hypothetical protein
MSTMDTAASDVPHANDGSLRASWRSVLARSLYTAIAHGVVTAGLMWLCLVVAKFASERSGAVIFRAENQLFDAVLFIFIGILVAAFGYNTVRKLYGLPARFLWPDLRLLLTRVFDPATRVASLITLLVLVFFLVQNTTGVPVRPATCQNSILFYCSAGILLTAWAWMWYLCANEGRVVCGVYAVQVAVIWFRFCMTMQTVFWYSA